MRQFLPVSSEGYVRGYIINSQIIRFDCERRQVPETFVYESQTDSKVDMHTKFLKKLAETPRMGSRHHQKYKDVK